jgi:putative PIN family toxin of toxin-antitoxin system
VIRIVADANVLVSAALARSPAAPSALVLDAALDGRVELVASPTLLAEIASVLMRPRLRRYLALDEAARFVADLGSQMTLISDAPTPHPAVCRDPNDDYLVALAVKMRADAIVTGDLDLLELTDPPMPVITPRAFLARLDTSA